MDRHSGLDPKRSLAAIRTWGALTIIGKTAYALLLLLCLFIIAYSLILPPLFKLLLSYRLLTRQFLTIIPDFAVGFVARRRKLQRNAC